MTTTSSAQETLIATAVTTAVTLVAGISTLILAYVQRRLNATLHQHHATTTTGITAVHETVKQMSSQATPSPKGSVYDNGFTCTHCIALQRD